MELIPTVLWLPKPRGSNQVDSPNTRKMMMPRVHAGEGLVMVVDGAGRFMTVIGVTISARELSGHPWEQWVTVTFDDDGPEET